MSSLNTETYIEPAPLQFGALHPCVLIDLTEVPNIDLTAARVLAFAGLDASRSGHHLRLRGCRPAVRRMMRLSRLARFVELEHVADAG